MSKITNYGILCIVIVGLFVISASKWAPESLDLGELKTSELLPLLGSLFLIALLVERTLEVILTTWRGPMAARKDRDIESKNKEISKLESEKTDKTVEIESARVELKNLVKDREEDRMLTRNLSLWLGLFLGILVSVVGIRFLHELVASIPSEGTKQATVFNIVDIVLTGCLIAGGSDGIHKISELYNSFIGSTTKIADERGKKAGKQP